MELYQKMVWLLNIIEIAACVIAFLCIKKLRFEIWIYFPFYLLFIVVLEFAGRFLSMHPSLLKYNVFLYNYIDFPVQFLFVYTVFYKHIYFIHKKPLVITCVVVYLASLCVNYLLINKIDLIFTSLSYTVGCIVILILSLVYFNALMKSPEILFFYSDMMFWFCTGIVVFYIGSLPYFALHNILAKKYKEVLEIYLSVWPILAYLMNAFFITGLLWKKEK